MYSKFYKIILLLLFGGLFQATVQESETSFVCPEEFGYFPHPSDCSQYYVCVFGGALLESCTGGLMYSHELQTCDWPRNVKTPCNVSIATQPNNNNHLVQQNLQPTTQVSSRQRVRGSSTTAPSSYAYKPIKIENYEEINSAISRNSQNNDEFTNGRNQRSYEQAQPSYKFSNSEKDVPLARHKRGLTIFNMFLDKIRGQNKPHPPPTVKIKQQPLQIINKKTSYYSNHNNNHGSGVVVHGPHPGSIMYPPSYYSNVNKNNNKPTYGSILHPLDLKTTKRPDFHKYLSMSSTSTVRPKTTVTVSTVSSAVKLNFHSNPNNYFQSVNRPVLIKASQISGYNNNNGGSSNHGNHVSQQNYVTKSTTQLPFYSDNINKVTTVTSKTVTTTKRPKLETKKYSNHDYDYYDDDDNESASYETNNKPKKSINNGGYTFLDIRNNPTTKWTTTKRPYNNHHSNNNNKYSSSREKNENRSVGGNGYNNNNGKKQQYSQQYSQPPPQQEDPYSNLRYAAAVPANNSASYVYAKEQEPQDDSSYYVYDDNSSANYDDVDYKAYGGGNQYVQQQVTTTTTTTTRRPKTTAAPAQQKQRTRTQSSSSSRRPTLKPKSQIVKDAAPVRDVYLDAPSRPAPVYESPTVNTPASKCRRDTCVLPDCNCGGKEIPGNLRPEETPQIVLLTFDDSVNDLNKNLYRDLFEKGRKNPNGCPISATFYVSHEWTDYSQVQNLAADGHEIASHSVSHSFGEAFSQKKWTTEINGQREILAAYGGVKLSEVRGMRAPFLAIGGNNMFKMLHDANFTYDSSMPVYENRPPSWPYTLDYKIFHDCMIPPCPTKSYPGVWEVPMVMWQDLKGGRCSMGDACSNPPTAEGVYQMLAKNFERHYTTNRAPFGLYYHAAWFTQPHHKEGFEAFLDTLVQMDDVWLVTNWQAIQWVRSPTPTSRINNFQPFNTCHATNQDRPGRCNHPRVCNLWHKSGVRYMKTCQTCPQQYPWTGNTGVPYTI